MPGVRTPEFLGGDVDLRINIYRRETDQENVQETKKTDQEKKRNSQEKGRTSQETDQEIKKANDSKKISPDNTELIKSEIGRNPSITQVQLQQVTGLLRSGVRYILQKLKDAGELQRIGSTKKGQWILNKRDENGT